MSSELKEYDLPFGESYMHCFEGGSGRALIFLHGSGPGCSTMSNFRRVLGPLADRGYHVMAPDIMGYGWSGRKPTKPYYDMDYWVSQATHLIDYMQADSVGLIGHSLSGSIALKTAAVDPRVAGVITTGTTGTSPEFIANGPRWAFPQGEDAIRSNIERTLYDPAEASEDEVRRRVAILGSEGHRAHFEQMFDSDPAVYLEAAAITDEEIKNINCPVTLMHGKQDRSFAPHETSGRLSQSLSDADLYVLDRCAHSVALERWRDFIGVVERTFPV